MLSLTGLITAVILFLPNSPGLWASEGLCAGLGLEEVEV